MVINLTSIWPNEINVGKVQEKYVGLLGFKCKTGPWQMSRV